MTGASARVGLFAFELQSMATGEAGIGTATGVLARHPHCCQLVMFNTTLAVWRAKVEPDVSCEGVSVG